MEALVSIIVPVYKVEHYLSVCVDSILAQTYPHIEVILVNDGSPDNCPILCDEYAMKDSRVKVIHKKNGGLSDARNAGMEIAEGDYLIFVDSDDLLPANAVETLLSIAVSEDADLVIGHHLRFSEEPIVDSSEDDEVSLRLSSVEAMADALRNGCASWARIYRREVHQDIPFPVWEINEDEAIVLPLLEKCKTVVKTNAVVYYYRCRSDSITTAEFSEKKMDWPRHCAQNLEYVRKHHPELEPDAVARYRGSLLWALREIALSSKEFEVQQKDLKRQLKKNSALFHKAPFKSRGERIRYLMMRYMPFFVTRKILRLRHSV